ncbi:kinase [bacterium]|nr:kinase [bacterium]
MVIIRAPFRISFFGGGTDYPIWYKNHGGAVFSTTIDKYCYISCRTLPPFFEHKYRIIYSKIENISKICEIEHPAVRGVFQYFKIDQSNYGLEIHYDADLPARSGLGSSSAFTVGLIKALHAYQGKMISKQDLAMQAIHVEQKIIKENVGSQDQVAAAYGGLNKIIFHQDESIQVEPVILRPECVSDFQKHLLFFFTGFTRVASHIAKKQIENTDKKSRQLISLQKMTEQAISILCSEHVDFFDFGDLLHEAWSRKKEISDKISTPQIDNIYNKAREAGAIGGKLIGAGGGGFLLLFAQPEKHSNIKKALGNLLYVPVRFEKNGCEIIYYNSELI